jgi:transcriptional regulator with XRE-family HTH domain
MNFGQKIKAARESAGWRQEDLAAQLGVTQQAVEKWESGKSIPRGPRMQMICDRLGIEPPKPLGMWSVHSRPGRDPEDQIGTKINRQMTTDDVVEELRNCLPDALQQNLMQQVVVKGKRYLFPYVSKNVIVHVAFGMQGGPSLISLRARAWRLIVAKNGSGDVPLSGRHYLLGVMATADGSKESVNMPGYVPVESQVTGILIEPMMTVEFLAMRIMDLEKTPTEADKMFAAMDQMQSLNNFDDE